MIRVLVHGGGHRDRTEGLPGQLFRGKPAPAGLSFRIGIEHDIGVSCRMLVRKMLPLVGPVIFDPVRACEGSHRLDGPLLRPMVYPDRGG